MDIEFVLCEAKSEFLNIISNKVSIQIIRLYGTKFIPSVKISQMVGITHTALFYGTPLLSSQERNVR